MNTWYFALNFLSELIWRGKYKTVKSNGSGFRETSIGYNVKAVASAWSKMLITRKQFRELQKSEGYWGTDYEFLIKIFLGSISMLVSK